MFILQAFQRGVSLEEISKLLMHQFPEIYATWEDAFEKVGEISTQYSE